MTCLSLSLACRALEEILSSPMTGPRRARRRRPGSRRSRAATASASTPAPAPAQRPAAAARGTPRTAHAPPPRLPARPPIVLLTSPIPRAVIGAAVLMHSRRSSGIPAALRSWAWTRASTALALTLRLAFLSERVARLIRRCESRARLGPSPFSLPLTRPVV